MLVDIPGAAYYAQARLVKMEPPEPRHPSVDSSQWDSLTKDNLLWDDLL